MISRVMGVQRILGLQKLATNFTIMSGGWEVESFHVVSGRRFIVTEFSTLYTCVTVPKLFYALFPVFLEHNSVHTWKRTGLIFCGGGKHDCSMHFWFSRAFHKYCNCVLVMESAGPQHGFWPQFCPGKTFRTLSNCIRLHFL